MQQHSLRMVFHFKHGGSVEGFTSPKEGEDVDHAIDQFSDLMTDFYTEANKTLSLTISRFRNIGCGDLIVNLNETCAISIEKI